jgi:hypothetical protein
LTITTSGLSRCQAAGVPGFLSISFCSARVMMATSCAAALRQPPLANSASITTCSHRRTDCRLLFIMLGHPIP